MASVTYEENSRRHMRPGAVLFDPAAGNISLPASRTAADGDGRPRRREQAAARGDTFDNTVRKLMRREIGAMRGRPDTALCAEKFRRFQLQRIVEEFSVEADARYMLRASSVMGPITRIASANHFIFAFTFSGFCFAFHQTANGSIVPYKRYGIWCINNLGEMIETIFYNKINDAIIIVYSMLTLRSCNNWDSGVPVFGSRAKYLPIFDDCNSIAVVSSALNEHVINVYELKSYNLVHSFDGQGICSIALRPGTMIMVHNSISDCISIEIWSTESWTSLTKLNHHMRPGREPLFIGLSNEILLVEEKGENMKVIDIWNRDNVTAIRYTEDAKLLLSFGLNASNTLLKFNNGMVVTCDCHGGQIDLLDGNEVAGNMSRYSFDTYVTRDKNFAVLYSRKFRESIDKKQVSSVVGSINICNTFSGKTIFKINPYDDLDLKVAPRKEVDRKRTKIRCNIHEALHNVTALYYDEERHIIYTGNFQGFVHMWSN
ncbi:hypothetical protein ACP70R_020739 [Stipagrostis hirtigluma subsp. patula]